MTASAARAGRITTVGFQDGFEVNTWLRDVPQMSRRLASRLGGLYRSAILASLAGQLKLDFELMGEEAYQVLDVVRSHLDGYLAAGDFTIDPADSYMVAANAAEQVRSLDEAVGAMTQFGWSHQHVGKCALSELLPEVQGSLAKELAKRIKPMFDTWRTREAEGTSDTPRRRGLVVASTPFARRPS